MGGGTLTATKEGDEIVLSDAAGTKATCRRAETRGRTASSIAIDAVLMPS